MVKLSYQRTEVMYFFRYAKENQFRETLFIVIWCHGYGKKACLFSSKDIFIVVFLHSGSKYQNKEIHHQCMGLIFS